MVAQPLKTVCGPRSIAKIRPAAHASENFRVSPDFCVAAWIGRDHNESAAATAVATVAKRGIRKVGVARAPLKSGARIRMPTCGRHQFTCA